MFIIRNAIILSCTSLALFSVLQLAIYTSLIDDYTLQILCLSGINIIVALSLNLISGFTGQLALGHAGFLAVGSYTTGILLIQGVSLPIAVVCGALMAAILGILIGFPTLRLRGDYLAIVTLGTGEIIRVLIINLSELTGGAAGLRAIPGYSPNLLENNQTAILWIFPCVVLTLVLISNLIRSSYGRALISIREDEIASQAMGIDTFKMKMLSFTFSAFLAGFAGALYAPFMGYLAPSGFDFLKSVFFVIIVVLGGMGSLTGTVLAGLVLTFAQEAFRTSAGEWSQEFLHFISFLFFQGKPIEQALDLTSMSQVFFGLTLILLMIFHPQGLLGGKEFRPTQFFTFSLLRKIKKTQKAKTYDAP